MQPRSGSDVDERERAATELVIEDGAAFVWFAYDLGQQVDLDLAQQRVAGEGEREVIRHQRRAPAYVQFHPAPLRLDERAESIAVGAYATDGRVESTLYDFGAVSIAYRIPISGRGLDDLLALAREDAAAPVEGEPVDLVELARAAAAGDVNADVWWRGPGSSGASVRRSSAPSATSSATRAATDRRRER